MIGEGISLVLSEMVEQVGEDLEHRQKREDKKALSKLNQRKTVVPVDGIRIIEVHLIRYLVVDSPHLCPHVLGGDKNVLKCILGD